MDGGVVDRLRRVDHRIWDGLLALAVAALGLVLVGIGRTSGSVPERPGPARGGPGARVLRDRAQAVVLAYESGLVTPGA